MSFLTGRLAAQEGAYFLQESKNAAARLAQKLPASEHGPRPASPPPSPHVLPEIVRHSVSVPTKRPPPPNPTLHGSPDPSNRLRSCVAPPQATFGPQRWELPAEQPYYSSLTAGEQRREMYSPPMDSEKLKAIIARYSQVGNALLEQPYYSSLTAGERRREMYSRPMDSEKLKAKIARYSQVGNALLGIAGTMLVIGEATAELLYTANRLQLHSVDDVRTKGKEHGEMIKEQLAPLRKWAEGKSKKWHYKGDKVCKEKLPRALVAKTRLN